jgi:hypothetical protein
VAVIHHYTRAKGGEFDCHIDMTYSAPAEFIVAKVPNGTQFRCYRAGVDITHDVDAMCSDGEFSIIESAGGFDPITIAIGVGIALAAAAAVVLLAPDVPTAPNQQTQSANNSLTDRNNKPRPYERNYDICGTVQSIPSDIMGTYRVYDEGHREFEYGYYYVARGFVDTPSGGVTDGDTLLSNITGSSANFYHPFQSPNNAAPYQVIGETMAEDLYVSTRSNEVDGVTLNAPNELECPLSDLTTISLSGTTGTITDSSGDAGFDEFFIPGDTVTLADVRVLKTAGGATVLDGTYTLLSVAATEITLNASPLLANWQVMPAGINDMVDDDDAKVTAANVAEVGFTDWVTVSKVKPSRILINIVASQGMFRDNGDGPRSTSATAEAQYQLLDGALNPYGPVYSYSQTLEDSSKDEVGMSMIIPLPAPSAVRVRVRRSSDKDFDYDGTVSDEIKYRDLYGQIVDTTPHYGDITTVHTVRRKTVQATAVKEPQLKVIATELLYRYLGGGIFDSVRTPNTQAAQSLIRVLQDPLMGALTLTAANMDKLLATQSEIEAYFGSPLAGQFCYTFDDASMTAQDMCEAIATAVFCTIEREGAEVRLAFEKPQSGPAMVFTHRSKVGDESWARAFKTRESFDSVEFAYIDPATNIKETLKIPEDGGAKPNKVDSKGVRNYQQAFWLANRIRQKDKLRKVTVDFTSTEEGIYVVSGRAISVVKGSRVSTYDGYIIAQSGLTLTLSQNIEFTDGDMHYIQLKRRDGSVESVQVEPSSVNNRTVVMLSTPIEPIYTGNGAVKTEFSFGNEARHMAQMVIPATIEPNGDKTVKITGYNYDPDYYLFDNAQPIGGSFSNGFSNGFNI